MECGGLVYKRSLVMGIIIVGNGSSILDNKNGKRIDSFDHVVRFNSFKIKDLEEFTGTKTTTWFSVNFAHIKEDFDRVIWHSWQNDESKDNNFQKLLEKFPTATKVKKEIIDEARSFDPDRVRSPSTGLIAIFYFLHQFESVTITGFDWWAREKHHYADNERRGTIHDPEIEMKVINKLIFQGKLRFL